MSKPVFRIDLMGSFGTGIASDLTYHKILALGTGTGIVPMMSLMNAHGDRLRQLRSEAFLNVKTSLMDVRKGVHSSFQILQVRFRLKMLRKHGEKCAYMRKVQQQIR